MLKIKSLLMFAFVILAATALSTDASGQTKRRRAATRTANATASTPAARTTPSGLIYMITQPGSGRQPKAGEIVIVHYTGTLTNGVKFDSSRDRGEPLAFKLGVGQVIKGWDEGFARMRMGDRGILIIPPQLGYGKRGAGNAIPPDATLIFIIELVDIKSTSLAEVLSKTLTDKGTQAMLAQYRELKNAGGQDMYTSESDLNGWGYRLMSKKKLAEAIEVFKLNVEAYPRSANSYDSLAEAYRSYGNKEQAIENYRKALELDPEMESARNALKEMMLGK